MTAGAACDLADKLERALAGAKIAAFQAEVCVYYANEREVREVVALRDNLRADQNIDCLLYTSPSPRDS